MNAAELRAAYEAGASIQAVADMAGRSYSATRNALIAAGTTLRPKNGGPGYLETNGAEKAARVLTALGLMLRGVDRHAIHRHGNVALGWNVTIDTVDGYMTAARAELKARYALAADDMLAEADARDDDLYREARANGDLRTCAQINAERNKRRGLYAPAKTELSGSLRVVSIDDLSDDELAAIADAARREG